MNTKDGYALKTAVDLGFNVCIISGGTNASIKSRLNGLGITDIYLGSHNKIDQMNKFLEDNEISAENVLYMGDDIPDLPPMQLAVLPTCPKDAVQEVQNISKYVSQKKGGKGCVRDVIEQVLKVQDKWNTIFDAKYD
jgi:3-deoxy-D-manno-octulosonate 8-phosphate phosphatase (KDO 8-P phosphatase)